MNKELKRLIKLDFHRYYGARGGVKVTILYGSSSVQTCIG